MKKQVAAGAIALCVGVLPGNGTHTPDVPETPPPTTTTTTAPSHPADRCQEDEDWATVHYQTPGAYDMNNGTRQCVNREELVMAGINELILDGTLIWEWDL
jgi:hypothetical protein